jgi:2-C-methyl-D-erythritol 2,4-cyclodiphosphate synthase
MDIKIGFGFDVHQLHEGYELWIGGVKIPSDKGSVGHSDGDVLIHAICDALLGAINFRDIGYHFPNTDPEYKDISSIKLLQKVCRFVREHGYLVHNVDSTVSLEEPKISGYISQMKKTLGTVSCLTEENISIKATTTEQLGFTGRKEGVAAQAVVLVRKV